MNLPLNESLNSTEPSPEEISQVAKLLSRLTPGSLPRDIFIEVARLTVTPIVEVVPLHKNDAGEIEVLLTQRDADDPTWPGMLHTPGTVVRASDSDEHNAEAFRRILQGELAGTATTDPTYVTSMLHSVDRGMEQAQVFWAEVTGEPATGRFYPVAALPDNLIASQLEFIQAAISHFDDAHSLL